MVVRRPGVEDDQDHQAQRKDQITSQAPAGFCRRASGSSEAAPGDPVSSMTRTVRWPVLQRAMRRNVLSGCARCGPVAMSLRIPAVFDLMVLRGESRSLTGTSGGC
jgi:hypothetical protein